MVSVTPHIINFSALERWDVKHIKGKITSNYPLVSLADFITEHNEKVKLYDTPEKLFKILGVNNIDGIFYAYDELGKNLNQSYKKVSIGDFAYNPYRINVGSIGRVPKEHDGAYISPGYIVFSIDESVIFPVVFLLILKSSFFNQTLRAATAGSVRMNLTYSLLENLKIPLPPLSVQKEIVSYWNDNNTKIEEAYAAVQRLSRNIPQMLVSQVGLLPLEKKCANRIFVSTWKNVERWGVETNHEMSRQPNLERSPYPIVCLSDVIDDLQNGWSPKCLTRQAQINEWGVLKVGAVSFGKFDESQNKAFPQNLKPKDQYEVKSGDLIISRANITQYVGACALVENVRSKLMLCDKLFRVVWKKDSPVLPEYLNEILKIPHLRWQIENNLTGASPTMKNISKPALMALQFPLPPINIQQKIISEINSKKQEISFLQDNARERLNVTIKNIEKMILGL